MVKTCGAKKRNGEPCQSKAVKENGRCRIHGGNSPGAPIKTGRYSIKHHSTLEAKAAEFAADPSPGDLTGELALIRAVLQAYLNSLTRDPSREEALHLFGMVEQIGKMVERIARILNTTALTQVEVQLLQARLIDLSRKYVDDDKRGQFWEELSSAFVGNGGNGTRTRAIDG